MRLVRREARSSEVARVGVVERRSVATIVNTFLAQREERETYAGPLPSSLIAYVGFVARDGSYRDPPEPVQAPLDTHGTFRGAACSSAGVLPQAGRAHGVTFVRRFCNPGLSSCLVVSFCPMVVAV